jgi:hypothetical protein
MVQYGKTLQLIGLNLIKVSKQMHQNISGGIIENTELFYINLQKAMNIGHSSLMSLESIKAPKVIKEEHHLLIISFKGLIEAFKQLLNTIDLNTLTINKSDFVNALANLKLIENKVGSTSREIIKKILLTQLSHLEN